MMMEINSEENDEFDEVQKQILEALSPILRKNKGPLFLASMLTVFSSLLAAMYRKDSDEEFAEKLVGLQNAMKNIALLHRKNIKA